MSGPRVTAVIVNWNGRELLEACLRSLAESDHAELTIIVVDNASTDGSPDVVREGFPDAELIENAGNEGYAAGANAGLKRARALGTDYALLLNNDLELAPDAVSSLVRAALEHPGAAFLAGEEESALDGDATAYVCRNFSCELPTTDVDKMLELLGER